VNGEQDRSDDHAGECHPEGPIRDGMVAGVMLAIVAQPIAMMPAHDRRPHLPRSGRFDKRSHR
jgi:hypothetical protein